MSITEQNIITIRKAVNKDLDGIIHVTREAFSLYQSELKFATELTPALKEAPETVLADIAGGRVNIADADGKIAGSIRYKMLSADIAYIYRFGVLNELSSAGTGSKLLDYTIAECQEKGAKIIALHTNAKYYKLARYYYGREFFVHSTSTAKGYIRALFIKELSTPVEEVDLTPALSY